MLLRERREMLGGPPAALPLHPAAITDDERDAAWAAHEEYPQQQAALRALVARELVGLEAACGQPPVRASSSDADLRRVLAELMQAVAVQAAGEQASAMLCELAGMCEVQLPSNSAVTATAGAGHSHVSQ